MLGHAEVLCAANAVQQAIVLPANALGIGFQPSAAGNLRSVTVRVDDVDGHWLYRNVAPANLVIQLPPDAKSPLNVSLASLETAGGEHADCAPAISSPTSGPATSTGAPVPPGPRVADAPLACTEPFRPARTLTAAPPEMPQLAAQQGIGGVVTTAVLLDATGTVTDVGIVSTPSVLLNNSALKAARGSTYQPEIFRCAPAPGAYTFTVEFSTGYRRL